MKIHNRPGDSTFNWVWGWQKGKFIPVQDVRTFRIPEGPGVELFYSDRPPSAVEVRTGKWSRPGGSLPVSELPRLPDREWMVQPVEILPLDLSQRLHTFTTR